MIHHRFENLIRRTVLVFLGIVVTLGAIQSFVLMGRNTWSVVSRIQDVGDMQDAAMHAFAGALLVVLGLELMESVRADAGSHRRRLELVLAASLIGVGRHVLLMDLHHVDGLQLVGAAAILGALAGSYWLVRRSSLPSEEAPAPAA